MNCSDSDLKGAAVKDDNTSGPRTTVYVFGVAVLALVAYYVKAEVQEIALWQALLAAAIPVFGLIMAAFKAWPKKPKDDDEDA
jgi:hypothetical protein